MPASETPISANLLKVSDLESSDVADRERQRYEANATRYERRIAQLAAKVERLSSRKAIKIVNTFGRALRTVDGRVRSLRPGR
ncbi:MAG: hypothetical protein ACI9ME_001126 [Ilumatobacter sp.]|jgi:hypothetical protein|tara:strand:- start:3825 stop:4073 length:249 start_codon:yes stop_codon:yes gene_type:complete